MAFQRISKLGRRSRNRVSGTSFTGRNEASPPVAAGVGEAAGSSSPSQARRKAPSAPPSESSRNRRRDSPRRFDSQKTYSSAVVRRYSYSSFLLMTPRSSFAYQASVPASTRLG